MTALPPNKNVWHVEPRNDLHPHLANGLPCPCKPKTTLTDDSSGFVIVHNPYDGREHSEPDHDRPSCAVCTPTLSHA